MPRWLYNEVNYLPQSNRWQEKPTGGPNPRAVSDRNFWLSEICETMENQAGWELETVVWDQGINTWHMLFKKPRT